MIYSIYVINKAGGLIYQKNYGNGLNTLSSNDYLILAGTFHGIHAISMQISPVAGSSGIEVFETENFTLRCFQTLTGKVHSDLLLFLTNIVIGTKFLLITDTRQRDADAIMRRLYELYADFVMKVCLL